MSFFSGLFGEKKPTDCSEKKVIMDKAKEDYDQCQKKLANLPQQQPQQQPTQQTTIQQQSTIGGKKSRKSKSKRNKKTKRTKKSKTQKRR